MKRNTIWLVGVLVAALVVNWAVGFIYGIDKPMESDAKLFLQIAQSVADGDGYKLREGFWPDSPTMTRNPGWPLLIAAGLKVTGAGEHDQEISQEGREGPVSAQGSAVARREEKGHLSPDAVMRCLCLLLNALNACLVMLLALMVTKKQVAGMCAALLYMCYPTALHLAAVGSSETLFVFLSLAGVLCLLKGCEMEGVWALIISLFGGALLGYAAIVKVNFVLWPGALFALIIAHLVWCRIIERWGKKEKLRDRELRIERAAGDNQGTNLSCLAGLKCQCLSGIAIVATLLLFLLPASLWSARNYRITGSFPVLSTLRGSVFYGANNDEVARLGKYWGYWIFPNSIPGETTMYTLSRSMSELEVDHYYFEKGKSYVRENISRMPVSLVGKLVRAYVPVPWRWTKGLIIVNAYRMILYILMAVGLLGYLNKSSLQYRFLLASCMAVNVLTVLVFWGCARFTFTVEPLLLPFAGLALVQAAGSMFRGERGE